MIDGLAIWRPATNPRGRRSTRPAVLVLIALSPGLICAMPRFQGMSGRAVLERVFTEPAFGHLDQTYFTAPAVRPLTM